jgi:hypothetical protein
MMKTESLELVICETLQPHRNSTFQVQQFVVYVTSLNTHRHKGTGFWGLSLPCGSIVNLRIICGIRIHLHPCKETVPLRILMIR